MVKSLCRAEILFNQTEPSAYLFHPSTQNSCQEFSQGKNDTRKWIKNKISRPLQQPIRPDFRIRLQLHCQGKRSEAKPKPIILAQTSELKNLTLPSKSGRFSEKTLNRIDERDLFLGSV